MSSILGKCCMTFEKASLNCTFHRLLRLTFGYFIWSYIYLRIFFFVKLNQWNQPEHIFQSFKFKIQGLGPLTCKTYVLLSNIREVLLDITTFISLVGNIRQQVFSRPATKPPRFLVLEFYTHSKYQNFHFIYIYFYYPYTQAVDMTLGFCQTVLIWF